MLRVVRLVVGSGFVAQMSNYILRLCLLINQDKRVPLIKGRGKAVLVATLADPILPLMVIWGSHVKNVGVNVRCRIRTCASEDTGA